MFTKHKTLIFGGVSVVFGALFGFGLILLLTGNWGVERVADILVQDESAKIVSVYAAGPNIVIEAEALQDLVMYGEFADIHEEIVFGTSTLVESRGNQQTWIIPIPEPVFVRELSLSAIGEDGDELDRYIYPTRGITEIYNELWGEIPHTDITLRVGEVATLEEGTVRLVQVLEDSRCPLEVSCIHVGRVVAEIFFERDDSVVESYIISSSEDEVRIEDYFVKITNVVPEKTESESIPDEQYSIEFLIISNQIKNE